MDKEQFFDVIDDMQENGGLSDSLLLEELVKALSTDDLEYAIKGICSDYGLDSYNDKVELIENDSDDKQELFSKLIVENEIIISESELSELLEDSSEDDGDYLTDVSANELADYFMDVTITDFKQALASGEITIYKTVDQFYIFFEG